MRDARAAPTLGAQRTELTLGNDEAESNRTKTPALSGTPLLLVGLFVVLGVQALFVLSYVGAFHNPRPHNLPIGVVGSSPLAPAVAKAVSVELKPYASEPAARRAIDQRKIYGALVSGPQGQTLIVVPAAGNSTAVALAAAFTAVAASAHVKLAVVQAHPLPAGDRAGSVSFLVVMALVIGGYLSATILTTMGPAVGRVGRAVILAGVAVIGALLADTLAGPVLGGIPAGHFFALWALFAFLMLSVAFAAAALQTVFGVIGTLLVVVCFIIFGAPAAGGTIPNAFQPGLWSTIGPFLPPGAGTTAVRNTIYFGASGITRALVVLAVYLAAGALVVLGVRKRDRGRSGATAEDEASAAAAAVVIG